MGHDVKLTLLANAGVLVEYRDTKFLFDGIQCKIKEVFSRVTPEMFQEMIEGEGKYRNIDYLLFSHEHVDHITSSGVEEYLRHNKVQEVFLPRDGTPKLKKLQQMMEDSGVPYEGLKLPFYGRKDYSLGDDITLTVFCARHMGPDLQDVENYCFLVRLGEISLLFTADADYTPENFSSIEEPVDVVFVNPLFWHNPKGRALLEEQLQPGKVVIYHIPFPEDDTMNHRKMVQRGIERHPGQGFDLIPFAQRDQQLVLTPATVKRRAR